MAEHFAAARINMESLRRGRAIGVPREKILK
jgi:hypothetical protein